MSQGTAVTFSGAAFGTTNTYVTYFQNSVYQTLSTVDDYDRIVLNLHVNFVWGKALMFIHLFYLDSVYIRTYIVIFQLGLTYIYTLTLLGHFL